MEVNGVSASLFSGASLASRSVTASVPVRTEESEAPQTQEPVNRGGNVPKGRALGVFKQELKFLLAAKLGFAFSAKNQVTEAIRAELSATEVASETITAASRLVNENPDVSQQALSEFRDQVDASAQAAREIGDDSGELADAVAAVDDGLEKLEESAAQNVTSSASVLSVESQVRERSTIRIRTQEGDIVKLDLRSVERLSADDYATSDESGSASLTRIDTSSSSRLRFSVEGDLNDAELDAIQNVFAQAEEIASDFFGGDLASAFSAASGFEFDNEQLARVNLRFRSREVTRVSYAEVVNSATPSAPAVEQQAAAAAPAAPVSDAPVAEPKTAEPAPVPAPVDAVEPTAAQPAEASPASSVPSAADQLAAFDFAPLFEFLDMIAGFLQDVSKGYEAEDDESGMTYQFHYSQSMKLEILKSVISVSAPADAEEAADTAVEVIDRVIEVDAGDD